MQQDLLQARGYFDTGDWQRAEECYRRLLAADPQSAEALHRLGRLALARNDLPAAAEWLQKAASLGSRDPEVWNHLGIARAKLKQFDRAIACFRQAVQIDPRSADAHYNWGNALSAVERLDEAVEQFRAAAVFLPDSPEVQYNMANALRDLGRLNDAVAVYRQALRLKPDHVRACNNLGNVLREQGRLAEAVETFRAALAIQPQYAHGHYNLGVTLLAQNSVAPAIAEFREALRIQPDLVAARTNLGKALAEQGRLDEALPLLQSARSQGQDHAQAQLRRAAQLRQEGRLDEAIACTQAAIEAHADFAAAHNELGLLSFAKQDYARAMECYRQAIRIRPDMAEAHNNLAIALFITGETQAGLEAVDVALRIRPDFAVAHLNRAVTWLRMGRFDPGWHEFEWRRLCDNHRLAPFPAPLWDGAAVPDRALLLHSEQGLGDTLQFIRYAPLVRQRAGSVILQCQPGLAPLLSRSAGVDRLIVRGQSLPEYHLQAPLLSLPEILGTTFETIPAGVPYLFADPALTETWRRRLADFSGFKVGIGWQGNPHYVTDRLRSFPLRHFAPLAQVPGVRLFSLQKGAGAEQIAALGCACPVVDFGPDFDAKQGTFMDSAAVMRNLDLVITSDSAVAHLAGGLGVPVWVALGYSCDWRWLDERQDCPWYPTMRLFRQGRLGDWEGVFAVIAAELARLVRGEEAGIKARNPKSEISNPKSQISDLKSQIPDLKSEIPNPKSEIPNPKSEIPNPKSEIPDLKSEISDLKSEIPIVFYLNLARRTDRRDRFLSVNATLARFQRWEAVEGLALGNEELLRTGMIAEPLAEYTPGALGCALSHKALWDRCAAGEAAVTVCEDDAIFNRHFSRQAAGVLAALPPDWDIILWGWNFDTILHVELIEGLKHAVMHFDPATLGDRTSEFRERSYEIRPLRLQTAFGTICYSLSPQGARSLLGRCFPLKNEVISIPGQRREVPNFGIDAIMNKHYAGLKSYVAFPPLVWTDNDKLATDVDTGVPMLSGMKQSTPAGSAGR